MKIYSPARIDISRRCEGYYLRWYYNGWHYFLFYPGQTHFVTEGENYRTRGTHALTVSSGQITLDQAKAIRTIADAKRAEIYTDCGWRTAIVEPATVPTWNNYIAGSEIILRCRIGSRELSKTGFSPLPSEPLLVTDRVFSINRNNFGFLFNEFDTGVAQVGHLTITPDAIFTMSKFLLDWCTVIVSQKNNTVTIYPNSENTGDRRDGVITLTCPGAVDPIYIAVYQYETGEVQIFESDRLEFQFGWDEYGAGIMKTAILTVVPDQVIGEENTIAAWATIAVNQVTNRMTVYPNDKNEGAERDGTITLSCPDADDIIIAITQYAIPIPDSPVAVAATDIDYFDFNANWQASGLATGYYLDVSLVSNFASFVAGYQNLDVGDVLTKAVTGLNSGTDYFYRVRAYNVSGTSGNSNIIDLTTLSDSIVTDPETLVFDYQGTPCAGTTITITASGAWTAAWTTGTHFTADKYNGAGNDIVTINCNSANGEPSDWVDTLIFDCGVASDNVVCTEYLFEGECE